MATSGDDDVSQLGVDEISSILSFLDWKEILRARELSSKWKEAAKCTFAPKTSLSRRNFADFDVKNRQAALALEWLGRALPGMYAITIDFEPIGRICTPANESCALSIQYSFLAQSADTVGWSVTYRFVGAEGIPMIDPFGSLEDGGS